MAEATTVKEPRPADVSHCRPQWGNSERNQRLADGDDDPLSRIERLRPTTNPVSRRSCEYQRCPPAMMRSPEF